MLLSVSDKPNQTKNEFNYYDGGAGIGKSAKKRILVAEKRAEKNKSVRSRVKTAVKKVDAAIAANDKAAAEAALKAAVSELDKATKKGIYHKNTTARKVSRLTIAVNKLA